MEINWNNDKNEILKCERNLSFEEVAKIIRLGNEIDIIPHPKRSNQKIVIVRIHGYIHAVPFTEDEKGMFLKTIFPSRTLNKQYGG
ncbi:MAG: toxin [Spirochaetales bacterium]|nr:toxin [Spirochaetales bacterium]